jgi:hypothetical protein
MHAAVIVNTTCCASISCNFTASHGWPCSAPTVVHHQPLWQLNASLLQEFAVPIYKDQQDLAVTRGSWQAKASSGFDHCKVIFNTLCKSS